MKPLAEAVADDVTIWRPTTPTTMHPTWHPTMQPTWTLTRPLTWRPTQTLTWRPTKAPEDDSSSIPALTDVCAVGVRFAVLLECVWQCSYRATILRGLTGRSSIPTLTDCRTLADSRLALFTWPLGTPPLFRRRHRRVHRRQRLRLHASLLAPACGEMKLAAACHYAARRNVTVKHYTWPLLGLVAALMAARSGRNMPVKHSRLSRCLIDVAALTMSRSGRSMPVKHSRSECSNARDGETGPVIRRCRSRTFMAAT